jgi:hypothetical protein
VDILLKRQADVCTERRLANWLVSMSVTPAPKELDSSTLTGSVLRSLREVRSTALLVAVVLVKIFPSLDFKEQNRGNRIHSSLCDSTRLHVAISHKTANFIATVVDNAILKTQVH